MTLNLDLPEDVAELLQTSGRDLRQVALEALGVEEYRASRLSDARFGRRLDVTRIEADRILKNHGVSLDYTLEDFERDGQPRAKTETDRRA